MRAFVVPAGSRSPADLRQVERPDPAPGPGEVVVRVRAASLNYRDQAIAAGQYPLAGPPRDVIPLSDGAGEVEAVGPGVTRVKRGDRVAGTFFQPVPGAPASAPPAALGAPLDGMLAQRVVLHESGVVVLPAGYSFADGACLPCAAVTAWHALFRAGRPVTPGDVVVVQGTGGVSVFALQFAQAAGCRVIATSSSDAKLERIRAMGASHTINYVTTPEWDAEVLKVSAGADCIVEVGGVGTLPRSMNALGRGGKITLIGLLTGRDGGINPYPLMFKGGSIHGIFVGDRPMFEEMNRAIEATGVRPAIDRTFDFDEAAAAYKHQGSGAFIGKVVIAIP